MALLALATTTSAQFSTTSDFDTTTPFWTYTSRLMESVSVSTFTRTYTTNRLYTYTTTRAVLPTVTPTATATSTSTSTNRYSDMKIIYQYYATGAFAESDLVPERVYGSSTSTTTTTDTRIIFSMPVTMTAPSSCPTQFTVTTSATVTVPSQVWPQVTPTSTKAGSSSVGNYGTYTTQTWYLSAGAAPFTSTSDYYYRYYIASCSTPPGAFNTGTRSGGGDSTSSSRCYSSYYYCADTLKVWIIVIASVIPALFLLGFLESWFWFRRLMMGKSAMRFGTVSWVLISLWVLCFTRMQDARSTEDQKLLQEKWKNMGSGAAFKAWFKWGFRHAYPVEHLGQYSKQTVGVVPVGQPVHPAMAQAPAPGFQPGPPGAPGAPGAPGPVYYYGPPPPGWIPTPDGQGFMPPQGYQYPPPQQAGYYGPAVSKEGTTVSSSPVSALGPQQQPYHQYPTPPQAPVSPAGQTPPQPQAPQPVYPAPNVAQMPAPTTASPATAPAVPAQQAPSQVSEAPANPARSVQPQQPKNDPNDRSLYE